MQTPYVKDFFTEIIFQVQRSGGPGGQHVNRTNSSVQLRWPYLESSVLNEEQKSRISNKMKSWISKEDFVLIRSDVFRDQESNKKEVLTRLQKLLTEAFHQPKKRKATKPSYSTKKKNAASKKHRSDIKKGRQAKWV